MNLDDKIAAFNTKKAQMERDLENESIALKKEFVNYIKDKSVPLVQRWSIFVKADPSFTKHHPYIYSAKAKGMHWIMDNWFDAPEVYGRGKKIVVTNLFEDVVYNGKIDYEQYGDNMEEILISALEEILEQNLGSFVYDW